MHDGVAHIALAREPRKVARRPPRPPQRLDRNQARGAGGFHLGRTQQIFQTVEHSFPSYHLGKDGRCYSTLIRGPPLAPNVSAPTAHTNASSRSGERPDDSPSRSEERR